MDHKNSTYTICCLLIGVGAGTGTQYEQDGSGSQPSWGTEFSLHHFTVQVATVPTQRTVQCALLLLLSVKAAGPDLDHLIPPNVNIQRV